MEATKLEIRNVAGIESLTIDEIGPLTVIEGANGEGKTSVLKAITAALKGPKGLGRLLRLGTTKGRVKLELDDGMVIERTFSEKGGELKVTRKGKKLAKPQAILDHLIESLSFNPVAFLTAKPKERLDILLETMGRDADETPIHEALAMADLEVAPKPPEQDWLSWSDEMRQFAFDERTGVNRSLKDQKSTIAQLEDSVGEPDDTDYDTRLKEIQGMVEGLAESRDAEIEKIRAKYQGKISDAKVEYRELLTKKDQAAKLVGARQLYDNACNKAIQLEAEASNLSTCLTRIDDAKKHILMKLPIKGLSISGENLYFEEKPFDDLSESERIVLALRLTADRVGALPVVCLDGIEALSKKNRERLAKHAKKMGLQIFAGRVTDDEALSVGSA